jgi:hypothetical protein
MKRSVYFSLLVGTIVGAVYVQRLPPITMSAKSITPTIPSISFTIRHPGHDIAQTRVFTMMGEQVAELSAESRSRFIWDGKDVDDQDVAPGFYVVQIEHNGTFWHTPVIVKR